jgi:hypothetical protein
VTIAVFCMMKSKFVKSAAVQQKKRFGLKYKNNPMKNNHHD